MDLQTILTIFAAIAPAIVLVIIIARRDPNREPLRWLITAIGAGTLVCGGVLLLAFLGWPDFETGTYAGAVLTSFISAALPEEGLKFCALYLLAKRCSHFDELFDGVVYAVCIGMGFAAVENILYISGEEEWIIISLSRALLSTPAHYFFAVIMGSFFAKGWFTAGYRKLYFIAALGLAILAHGLYDTLLFSMRVNEDFSGLILIAFLLCFRWIRRYVKRLTIHMLQLNNA